MKIRTTLEDNEFVINIAKSAPPELQNLPPIILRKDATGAWLVSPQTVEHINDTWEKVKDLAVLGNLKDIALSQSLYVSWAEENLPAFWLAPAFLNIPPWKWVGILIALVCSYLVGVVIRVAAKLIIRLKTGRIGSELSKTTLDSAGHGISLITNAIVYGAVIRALQFPPEFKANLLYLALILFTVGFAWLAIALVEYAINRLTPKIADAERAEKLFLPILRNLGRIIIIVLALLFFLERVGFNVTGLIAGLGIGGLVVALAAKDSVENLFGSLTLIFEMPFQIGDWVICEDIEGTVEEISLRSTTLRTFHDSTLLVPNSKFVSNAVENMGRRRYRRLKTTIGITYDATAEEVETFVKTLRKYILNHPKTWDDKIHIVFNDYGPSSLNILLYIFIDAANWGEELLVREELLLGVMRIAEESNVDFAFPTQKMIIDTDKSSASMRILTDE